MDNNKNYFFTSYLQYVMVGTPTKWNMILVWFILQACVILHLENVFAQTRQNFWYFYNIIQKNLIKSLTKKIIFVKKVKKILLADRDLPGLSNRAKLPSEHVPREPGLQGGEGHEGGVHLSQGRQPCDQGVHWR
jgi:hypothetical protein